MGSSETAEPASRPLKVSPPGPGRLPAAARPWPWWDEETKEGTAGAGTKPRGQRARRREGETRLRHRAGPAARYLSGRVLPQAVLGRQVETGATTQGEGSTQEQAATPSAAAAATPRRSAVGSARGPQPPRGQQ